MEYILSVDDVKKLYKELPMDERPKFPAKLPYQLDRGRSDKMSIALKDGNMSYVFEFEFQQALFTEYKLLNESGEENYKQTLRDFIKGVAR